jgi:hypothetical protein
MFNLQTFAPITLPPYNTQLAQVWGYVTNDTMAQIETPGYFVDLRISVNDGIRAVCLDGMAIYRVASLNPITLEKQSGGGGGSDSVVGPWTPAPFGLSTAGSPTGAFAGEFIKNDRHVTLYGTLNFTDKGGAAGGVAMSGIPFPLDMTYQSVGKVGDRTNFTNWFPVHIQFAGNNLVLRNSEISVPLDFSDIEDTAQLVFTIDYITDPS